MDGGGVPALVRLLPAGGDLATAAAGVLRELCALRCGRVRSSLWLKEAPSVPRPLPVPAAQCRQAPSN